MIGISSLFCTLGHLVVGLRDKVVDQVSGYFPKIGVYYILGCLCSRSSEEWRFAWGTSVHLRIQEKAKGGTKDSKKVLCRQKAWEQRNTISDELVPHPSHTRAQRVGAADLAHFADTAVNQSAQRISNLE